MPRHTAAGTQRNSEIMDDSLRLLARMIVRRHFDSQAPDAQGRSNGTVVLRDAPANQGNGRDHLLMAGDDLLTGRAHR